MVRWRMPMSVPVTLVAGWLALGVPAAAQTSDGRIPVMVDYVGADGVYLPVGADQGAIANDTIPVFAEEEATEPLGAMTFTSVTRRRSVARTLHGLTLERSDTVYLTLEPPAEMPGATPVSPRIGAAEVADPPAQVRPSAAGGPRVSGRIALELDARETRTAWSGDLFGETRRRFATPTTRLSFVASDLPAGTELRASLRASYRYADLTNGPPPTSIRAYELAATKRFSVVPLEITLGRFTNPYERYSAYWDGLLVRVGGRHGVGAGVVAGFEPGRGNEAPSGAVPKVTGFADFTVRGERWRYHGDASFHALRPAAVGSWWRYVGWSQRLSVGRLDVDQRLRVDGDDGGSWTMSELRVRAGLRAWGPLRLRAAYGRIRPGIRVYADPLGVPGVQLLGIHRDEMSAGLGASGRVGSLYLDAGRHLRRSADAGRSISGRGSLRVGGVRVLMSGRHWRREEMESLALAPGLAFPALSMDWMLGYRFYRTVTGFGVLETTSADIRVGMRLLDLYRITVRAEQQWGRNLSGTRLQLGIWRSF